MIKGQFSKNGRYFEVDESQKLATVLFLNSLAGSQFSTTATVVACGLSKATSRREEAQEYAILDVPGIGRFYTNELRQYRRSVKTKSGKQFVMSPLEPFQWHKGEQLDMFVAVQKDRTGKLVLRLEDEPRCVVGELTELLEVCGE